MKTLPHVYVAAGGPVVARYAGRAGDWFICIRGKGMGSTSTSCCPRLPQALRPQVETWQQTTK